MSADRHQKNIDWYVATEDGSLYSEMRDGVGIAVLMDIRRELQTLNALMHCHNTRAIPELLRGIKRNTTKPKRRVKT